MQDFSYAQGLLKEVADFGYPPALYKMGYCYEHGLLGIEHNPVIEFRVICRVKVLNTTQWQWTWALQRHCSEWQAGI